MGDSIKCVVPSRSAQYARIDLALWREQDTAGSARLLHNANRLRRVFHFNGKRLLPIVPGARDRADCDLLLSRRLKIHVVACAGEFTNLCLIDEHIISQEGVSPRHAQDF